MLANDNSTYSWLGMPYQKRTNGGASKIECNCESLCIHGACSNYPPSPLHALGWNDLADPEPSDVLPVLDACCTENFVPTPASCAYSSWPAASVFNNCSKKIGNKLSSWAKCGNKLARQNDIMIINMTNLTWHVAVKNAPKKNLHGHFNLPSQGAKNTTPVLQTLGVFFGDIIIRHKHMVTSNPLRMRHPLCLGD